MHIISNETFSISGGPEYVHENFSGRIVSWGSLRGRVFINCDFRDARFIGPGLNMRGMRLLVSTDKVSLLNGFTIEQRNVEILAQSIQFLDPSEQIDGEAQGDTERGFDSGALTAKQFLRSLEISIVDDDSLPISSLTGKPIEFES